MFLPSHAIYLVKKDGTKENVSMTDCSTKKEVREEVKDLIKYYSKTMDTSIYVKAQYFDRNGSLLYECTVEECLNEK